MRQLTVVALFVVLVLALAPGVVAKQHGTDRPIWANLSGEVNFYQQADPDCPVLTVSDSHGTMSHLGRVLIHWTHCPPITHPEYTNQHFTITSPTATRWSATTTSTATQAPWTSPAAPAGSLVRPAGSWSPFRSRVSGGPVRSQSILGTAGGR